MRKVYIDESKVGLIKEYEEPITRFRFFQDVKKFLQGLLDDPINARPSEKLQSQGLTDKVLRQRLIDNGIVKRKENIDEPYDEEKGKKVSRYYLSYKIPKKGFKEKMSRLYDSLFNKVDEERVYVYDPMHGDDGYPNETMYDMH